MALREEGCGVCAERPAVIDVECPDASLAFEFPSEAAADVFVNALLAGGGGRMEGNTVALGVEASEDALDWLEGEAEACGGRLVAIGGGGR